MQRLLIVFIMLFSVSGARAFTNKDLKKVTSAYYLSKLLKTQSKLKSFDPGPCYPPQNPGTTCMEETCKRLGSYQCDDQTEIFQVIQMCSGQYDGSCINTMCNRLGSYQCDDFSEIKIVASLCRNQFGGNCVETVCTKLGGYQCDDFSELKNVSRICSNTSYGTIDCIQFTCDRLGSYQCDDFSELERVIKSCNGQ
ncbi:MAG: hypothetical protein ACOYL6_14525 [Bacteriovoracaceae bacterium]